MMGTRMLCPECSGQHEFCKLCEGQGVIVVLTMQEWLKLKGSVADAESDAERDASDGGSELLAEPETARG